MAAIYQHCQLYAARTTKIHYLIERRPNCAPRVEHVVDQYYSLIFYILRQLSSLHHRFYVYSREVVAIECYIERADRRARPFKFGYSVGYTVGQRHTAAADADKKQLIGAAIALDYL